MRPRGDGVPRGRRIRFAPLKMRFANQQDAAARRAGGRKRSMAEMCESRKRLREEWGTMPDEGHVKLELREELKADVEARRLEHLAPPCDGVRGGHPVMGSGVRGTQPRSGLGRGSSKTPLAASALEAWRRDQPARGLRPMAQAATTRGWVSRVAKEAAAPRPRGHFA